MARWRGGEVARWRGGEAARWRGGEVARWRGGEAAGEVGRTLSKCCDTTLSHARFKGVVEVCQHLQMIFDVIGALAPATAMCEFQVWQQGRFPLMATPYRSVQPPVLVGVSNQP